jgi:hypothetical protein
MSKDIQLEINEVLEIWDLNQQEKFLSDIIPIFELYYSIDKESEIFEKKETAEDAATVRLIRAVYLISKMAESHSGKIAAVRMQWPKLWKRMEQSND